MPTSIGIGRSKSYSPVRQTDCGVQVDGTTELDSRQNGVEQNGAQQFLKPALSLHLLFILRGVWIIRKGTRIGGEFRVVI
jgi:hypothetical protein